MEQLTEERAKNPDLRLNFFDKATPELDIVCEMLKKERRPKGKPYCMRLIADNPIIDAGYMIVLSHLQNYTPTAQQKDLH